MKVCRVPIFQCRRCIWPILISYGPLSIFIQSCTGFLEHRDHRGLYRYRTAEDSSGFQLKLFLVDISRSEWFDSTYGLFYFPSRPTGTCLLSF